MSNDGFPPGMGRPELEEEDYLSVPEDTSSQQSSDVEEFLQGLSSDDLDQLKKYVADDMRQEESTGSEEIGVVRRLAEDDQNLNDNIGDLIFIDIYNFLY